MTNLYMGYKNFSWPRLPDTLAVDGKEYTAVLQQAEGGSVVQELGMRAGSVTGSGSFVGEQAATDWTALCAVFQQGGPGALYLPGSVPLTAVFTQLQLTGVPRNDRVIYRFAFAVTGQLKRVRTYTVQAGDCLWSAAAACGVSADVLRGANIGRIRWANELTPGMELSVP